MSVVALPMWCLDLYGDHLLIQVTDSGKDTMMFLRGKPDPVS